MSQATLPQSQTLSALEQLAGLTDTLTRDLIAYLQSVINDVSEEEATARVKALRETRQQAGQDISPATLTRILIQRKCLKTGAIGGVTSG